MGKHIFHRSGYDKKTVIVSADSEIEAKGKIHDTIYGDLEYKGKINRILKDNNSDVIDINNI